MRKYVWVASAIALAMPVVATGSAAWGSSGGPASATVKIVGVETFKPNFYQNTFAFPTKATKVRSGGTVTWNNLTSDAHSMSLIAERDFPTSVQGNAVTNAIFAVQLPTGAPPNFVVDDGVGVPPTGVPDFHEKSHSNGPTAAPTVGDSVLIDTSNPANAHGGPTSVTVKANAPAGTELFYVCIFHPWMQGEIDVTG
jgi:plastocyanin